MGRSSRRRARKSGNKLTRSRPHPDDHPFSGVFPFTHTPATKLVLFALAMCWEYPKDRLRLQMVLNTYPATRVISTSWSKHTCGSMRHCEANFGDRKGLRDLGKRITEERSQHPNACITVALDWNWLHMRYYEENYRLHNWFDGGIKHLLDAGANKILLPYDGGVRHVGYSCMATALAKVRLHPGFDISFVGLAENPLWVASSSEHIQEELAGYSGGDNEANTRNFLHPKTPFVQFTLPTASLPCP